MVQAAVGIPGDGEGGGPGREASESARPMLVFRAGCHWVAVPPAAVREVAVKGYVTRLPAAPPHLAGVTLVRGRVVPVVALDALFDGGGPASEPVPTLPRLVILEDGAAELAVIADETAALVAIEAPSVEPGAAGRFLVAQITWRDRPLYVVDVPSLFRDALAAERPR